MDSNASIIYRMKFITNSGAVYELNGEGGRPHANDVFMDFESIAYSQNRSWTGELTLLDTTGVLETALIAIGPSSRVVFEVARARDGFASGRSHAIHGLVITMATELNDVGVILRLSLVASTLYTSLLTKYTRGWKALEAKTHEVFVEIAKAMKWVTERDGKSTVCTDSTLLSLPRAIDTSKQPPIAWVRDQLIPLSITEDRVAFTCFCLSGNVIYDAPSQSTDIVYFQPYGWHTDTQSFVPGNTREFVYRKGDGDVLSAKFDDQSLLAAIQGARSMTPVSIDSIHGTILSSAASTSGVMLPAVDSVMDSILSPVSPPLVGAQKYVPDYATVPRRWYVVGRDKETVDANLAAKHQRLVDAALKLDIVVMGTADVFPSDQFTFTRHLPDGRVNTTVSGNYRALVVRQRVSEGGWVTSITAVRGAFFKNNYAHDLVDAAVKDKEQKTVSVINGASLTTAKSSDAPSNSVVAIPVQLVGQRQSYLTNEAARQAATGGYQGFGQQ